VSSQPTKRVHAPTLNFFARSRREGQHGGKDFRPCTLRGQGRETDCWKEETQRGHPPRALCPNTKGEEGRIHGANETRARKFIRTKKIRSKRRGGTAPKLRRKGTQALAKTRETTRIISCGVSGWKYP